MPMACRCGLMAMADENVLIGMLNALIDNAVTFTQKGGRIELSAVRADGHGAITISDNGPGVAAADLNRILQPFEHAGRAVDHAKGAGSALPWSRPSRNCMAAHWISKAKPAKASGRRYFCLRRELAPSGLRIASALRSDGSAAVLTLPRQRATARAGEEGHDQAALEFNSEKVG